MRCPVAPSHLDAFCLITESFADLIKSVGHFKPKDITELIETSEVEPNEVVEFANDYIKEIREDDPYYDPIEGLHILSDYMNKHGIIYDTNDRLLRKKDPVSE